MAIEINRPKNNKGRPTGYLRGAVLCYLQMQEGGLKYESEEREYVVDAVIPMADAKKWKKLFPKNGIKKYTNKEFQKKFNIEPPFKGKSQFVVKVRTDVKANADIPGANVTKGEAIPYKSSLRPKVFVPGSKKGVVKDVTMEVLVANGSVGDIAFRVVTRPKSDIEYPKLQGILVSELIEYTPEDTSPFGTVEADLEEDEEFDNGFGEEESDDDDLSDPEDLSDDDDDDDDDGEDDDLPLLDDDEDEDDDDDDDFDFDDEDDDDED